MDVCAAGGDKGGLRYEEEDPRGEGGAVDVNDQAGQRRAENAGEKIATRESDKDADEHEEGHDGKEVVVVAAARWGLNGADGLLRLSDECGQDASVWTWTGEECASTWKVKALYTELVWSAQEDSVRAGQRGRSEDRPLQRLADRDGSGFGGGLSAGLGH